MTSHQSVTVDSRIPHDWADGEMRASINRALDNTPIVLPPKWLYDDKGSELFTAITQLDVYYQTEAERAILVERTAEIARLAQADTIIELGAGNGDKTRTLLDGHYAAGYLKHFVPVDVSEATLVRGASDLAARYEGVQITATVADFIEHLHILPPGDTRLVAFLGSTIGNLYVEERRAFLGALADNLNPGDWVLIGVDLMKSVDRILAAYHDDEGITEAFVKNVLSVLNHSLGADFDPTEFDYIPFWDGHENRLDARLRSCVPQRVTFAQLDRSIELGEGDEIRVEVSTKFTPEQITAELDDAGFTLTELWTDPANDFGLALAHLR